MNVVYIKIKGKDEIAFPECYYEHCDNFLVVWTIGHSLEVGAFNKSIVEYVYLCYEGEKTTSRWVDKIKSGQPTE